MSYAPRDSTQEGNIGRFDLLPPTEAERTAVSGGHRGSREGGQLAAGWPRPSLLLRRGREPHGLRGVGNPGCPRLVRAAPHACSAAAPARPPGAGGHAGGQRPALTSAV